MLAVTVDTQARDALMCDAEAGYPIKVDLWESCIQRHDGKQIGFTVPAWRREALLHGWDEIALILRQDGQHIEAFERTQRAASPWLY